MSARPPLLLGVGRWWLRRLLGLYPRPFVERFGPDLRSAVDDRLDAVSGDGRVRIAAVLVSASVDLAVAALKEWIRPSFRTAAAGSAGRIAHSGGALSMPFVQDVRLAARALARRPAFSAVVVFTLAIGIGSSTAVFTVVNGVLLRSLPFPDAEELVAAYSYDTGSERTPGYMSQPDLESMRGLPSVRGIEGVDPSGFTVTGTDVPERVAGARVTGGLLTLLGVAPLAGRDLTHEDNLPDAPLVVVLSRRFWQSRLGGRPDVVGSTLELGERGYEVVGVAPEGFHYPDDADLWVAYRLDPSNCGRGCHVFPQAIGRLAPGKSMEAAGVELTGLALDLESEYPDTNTDKGLYLESLLRSEVGDVRVGLWVVLGAVGLVLVIVCANTANLLMVRASERAREVALRTALGASRGRLAWQTLSEALVLTTVGAGLGMVVSAGLLRGLRWLAGDHLPRLAEVTTDGRVLGFVILVSATVALLFGLAPAAYAGRGGAEHLLGGARGGAGRAGARTRSLLLATEVAFSIVLLAGSGLLLRSLDRLYRVEMGFDGARVSRFTLSLPSARYAELEVLVPFFRRLEENVRGIPGVESVGSVYGAPLSSGDLFGTVLVEGRPDPEPGEETVAAMRPATADYFSTMGMRVLRGRGIEPTDDIHTEPVAVVSETFVRESFPGEEVLGARIRVTASFGYGPDYWTVVGVVRDVRRSMSGDPVADVYVPHAQFGPGFMTVHVRSRQGAPSPIPAIREEVRRMDPNLVLLGVETVADARRRTTATTRLFFTLVSGFAGVAVLLAAVGLYGVVTFLVARRTREFGIRMALGARRANVTRMVLQQGLRPTVLGVAAGVVASITGGRVMESLLFGVRPSDPLVLTGVSALVLLVASAASLLPARRATRVDPTEAFRAE